MRLRFAVGRCSQRGCHCCWSLWLSVLALVGLVLACCPEALQRCSAAITSGAGQSRPTVSSRAKQLLQAQVRAKRVPRSTSQLSTMPTAATAAPTTAAPTMMTTNSLKINSALMTTAAPTVADNEIPKKTLMRPTPMQSGQAKQQQQHQKQKQQQQRLQSNSRAGEKLATSTQNQQQQRVGSCEYEKGTWQECQSNGVQQRIMRLKQQANSPKKCGPLKIMRRECRLGCKYVRGEWSASCTDGVRVRIDTLVGTLAVGQPGGASQVAPTKQHDGPNGNTNQQQQLQALSCQPQRKVTKDCGRTCHYIKSAWSDCTNGFKTRNLTLEATALPRAGCAKEKQVRRECRPINKPVVPKLTQLQRKRLRLQQPQQTVTNTSSGPAGEQQATVQPRSIKRR